MGKHATFCFCCWMQDRSVLSNWSSAVTFSRARLQKMVSKRRPPIRKLWRFLSLGWFKLLLAGNHGFSSSNQGVSSINMLSLTIEPIFGFWCYSRKSEWSLSPEVNMHLTDPWQSEWSRGPAMCGLLFGTSPGRCSWVECRTAASAWKGTPEATISCFQLSFLLVNACYFYILLFYSIYIYIILYYYIFIAEDGMPFTF